MILQFACQFKARKTFGKSRISRTFFELFDEFEALARSVRTAFFSPAGRGLALCVRNSRH
ncbi:MAG: hypothetical protein ACI4O3_03605 [Oscillospiraceae bacterium]